MKRRSRKNPLSTVRDLLDISQYDIGGGFAKWVIGGVEGPQFPGYPAVWSGLVGKPFVSLTEFGAIADGTYDPVTHAMTGTDNTAAINDALATGKPVLIPAGYFYYAGAIKTSAEGGGLVGSGSRTSFLMTDQNLDRHIAVVEGTKNTKWVGFKMLGPFNTSGSMYNRALTIGVNPANTATSSVAWDASGTYIDDFVTEGYCVGVHIAAADYVTAGTIEVYESGDSRAEPGAYGITCSGSHFRGRLLRHINTTTRPRHSIYYTGIANDCFLDRVEAKGVDLAVVQNRAGTGGGQNNGFGTGVFEDCNTNSLGNETTLRGVVNFSCINDTPVAGAGGARIGDYVAINCGGIPGPSVRYMPNSQCGTVQIYGHAGRTATLAAAASVGATTLSLAASVPIGTYLVDSERVKITAVSGSGPYTATLESATTAAHSSNTIIASHIVDHYGAHIYNSENVRQPLLNFVSGYDPAGLNDAILVGLRVDNSPRCYGGGVRMHSGAVFRCGARYGSSNYCTIPAGAITLDGTYSYGVVVDNSVGLFVAELTLNGLYVNAVRWQGTADVCVVDNVRTLTQPTGGLFSDISTAAQFNRIMRAVGYDIKEVTTGTTIDVSGFREIRLNFLSATTITNLTGVQQGVACRLTAMNSNATIGNQAGGVGELWLSGSAGRVMNTRAALVISGHITGASGAYTYRWLEVVTRVAQLLGDTISALPVGSIEVGHASDTTVTRLSAGQLGVESNPIGTKVAVPASAAAPGVQGQWALDANYVYYCRATNTWVRAAVASW